MSKHFYMRLKTLYFEIIVNESAEINSIMLRNVNHLKSLSINNDKVKITLLTS